MLVGLLGWVRCWSGEYARGRTAVSIRKILIPPLGMATGFSMFIVPAFRILWLWGVVAFLIGAIALAYPLLRTS